MVNLWGRPWTRRELLARVGRLDQVAGVQLGGLVSTCGLDHSEACDPGYRQLPGPRPDFSEECYEHDMVPGPDGMVSAAVINRSAGLGVYQRHERAAFPHHITWRQLGSGT